MIFLLLYKLTKLGCFVVWYFFGQIDTSVQLNWYSSIATVLSSIIIQQQIVFQKLMKILTYASVFDKIPKMQQQFCSGLNIKSRFEICLGKPV